jgi:hypothetical protein
MELSSEDALRLHVLLANQPQAIRIDETRLTLDALLPAGETRVQLHPNGRSDAYLRQVRALLSERALGNPGGYPLYLQRWTRMGRMRDESLEQLLLLGEPSAVFAVVCAAGLTDELARRAWWAYPDAENARRMLATPEVVAGRMGPVLARHLVEHLPFEEETEKQMESVRMALQPRLLGPAEVAALWQKASRKPAFLVGFLAAIPERLPLDLPAHPVYEQAQAQLEALAAAGNPLAGLLGQMLSPKGQAFLDTCRRVLAKPPTQDVVSAALDAIRAHLRRLRPEGDPDLGIDELIAEAQGYAQTPPAQALLQSLPELAPQLQALRVLSGLGYGVVRPVFRQTSAIGTLMRSKLEPVLGPLERQIVLLRG